MQIEAERDHFRLSFLDKDAGENDRAPTKKGGSFIPPFKFKVKF
jgi:hypothetical protein